MAVFLNKIYFDFKQKEQLEKQRAEEIIKEYVAALLKRLSVFLVVLYEREKKKTEQEQMLKEA